MEEGALCFSNAFGDGGKILLFSVYFLFERKNQGFLNKIQHIVRYIIYYLKDNTTFRQYSLLFLK
jgi:hypothetical protein